MVEVRRRDGETSDSLVRRFTRVVQQSKILPQARNARFYTKPKSKRLVRQEALYKARVRVVADKLKRMGIFTEKKLRDIKQKVLRQGGKI